MSQVITFLDYTPAARFDSVPWSEARIGEAEAFDGPWTQIDVLALSPLDPDPSDPLTRDLTTSLASDTPELWYRIIFADASGGTGEPTTPVQNLAAITPYATPAELFRVLRVLQPTEAQTIAADGDLATATLEINAEIDWADDHAPATAAELALMKDVCINRAADLWRHRESAPGILGITDESMPTTPGRYSWARYVARLSDLKDGWGIA